MEEFLRLLEENQNRRHLLTTFSQGKYIDHKGERYVNLSSNDYLGIGASDLQSGFGSWLNNEAWTLYKPYGVSAESQTRTMFCRTEAAEMPFNHLLMSNPSSRLMTGNSIEYDLLERHLSHMYNDRGILILGSGYHANTGVLPALTGKNDLIVADKLIHASLIDALQLSDASHQRFAHNDMGHLDTIISKNIDKYKNIWVVTESVFSMDGDRADLTVLHDLKKRYGVKLYLDEAHGFGVFGPNGEGLAAEMGLSDCFDIIICTLGKAMASTGAFVVSDTLTREVLINRMRPLIFSTAMPPINILWTLYLLLQHEELSFRRKRLRSIIATLNGSHNATQIMPVMAGSNQAAMTMTETFRENGFWVTPIRYPTVPQGSARIRISLNPGLDDNDINKIKELCDKIG